MSDRLSDAEVVLRHIIESAPWDGEEAHRQLLKEARAYFVKHPTGLCLLKTTAQPVLALTGNQDITSKGDSHGA